MSNTAPREVEISIIIPTYNEEARVKPSLEVIMDYLRSLMRSWELIVVDDGSRDATVDIVQATIEDEPHAHLIHYKLNRGKGYAVSTGVLAAEGRWVVFIDADLSTPVEEIGNALQFLESGYDMVVGSRAHPESQIERQPSPYRRLASAIFDLARYSIVGLHQFPDTQCGFKAFRNEVVRPLYERSVIQRFMFDVEILYLANCSGLRLCQMPVRWADVAGSKVRFFSGVYQMFRDLVRIRWVHRGFDGVEIPRPTQNASRHSL